MPKESPLYSTFETDLGVMALVWSGKGILAVHMPEKDNQSLIKRIGDTAKNTGKLPAWLTGVCKKIKQHLQGKPQDFKDIPLDYTNITSFRQKIYQATREIKAGTTTTYGRLAEQTGHPRAAQAIGQALAHNPFPLIVPCHRVIAQNNQLCGFSAYGGIATKKILLEREGYNFDACVKN